VSKGVFNLLSAILRTFFVKSRFIGFQNSLKDYSVCIANHLGSFGPVAIMSSLSGVNQKLHPWVIAEVTDLRKCADYLRRDFVEKELKLRSALAERVSRVLSRICVDLMTTVHAIPVYKRRQDVHMTFERSVEDLESGNNLLIFPENDESKQNDDVCTLNSGFIRIAKWVFERTHKRVRFYPIAINPYARAVQIGKPVLFNPRAPFGEEKKRIKEELERRITAMYEELARRRDLAQEQGHQRLLPLRVLGHRKNVA
jgi:1-acyl-sn-glycerol-3-phosphate acyltransferase